MFGRPVGVQSESSWSPVGVQLESSWSPVGVEVLVKPKKTYKKQKMLN